VRRFTVKWENLWYNPLGLSVIPGNQTYFYYRIPLQRHNFYEFVSDQYATVQWDHFGGRIFSNSIYAKLVEKSSSRGVYGTIQMPEESMLQVCSIWLKMCIGSIVPELETSSKCFVSILPGEEII
jgi:hypothetical protein